MGWNSVAVILHDQLHKLPEDIQEAIRGQRSEWRNFLGGKILSSDHADGYQVVVVHGNTGWRVDDSRAQSYTELNWSAIDQMTRALERHGFKVTKLRKPKAERA